MKGQLCSSGSTTDRKFAIPIHYEAINLSAAAESNRPPARCTTSTWACMNPIDRDSRETTASTHRSDHLMGWFLHVRLRGQRCYLRAGECDMHVQCRRRL